MGEDDDVGADRRGIEAAVRPALRHGLGQARRPGVILGQALDHLAQGDEAGRREHTRLAHPATQTLALQASVDDHFFGSGQQRADRRAQALGQAAHHGGDRRGPLCGAHTRCRLGVEEPGAVQVDGHVTGGRGHGGQLGLRPQGARRRHVRVLDTDQRHRGLMVRRRRPEPAHVVRGEDAVGVVHGEELHPGVARRRAVLVRDDVLATAGDHRGTRRGQDTDGELVGHGPRRDEDGSRLAQASGESLLQGAHRGVLPVVVVPDHRLRHGAPHGGGRLGDGVAAKVDQIGHAATLTTRR